MTFPLVQFRNVLKKFGSFTAVKNINLDIEAEEFIAIMGPSGCGKTTMLRMLAGLETPSEGEILIDGKVMNNVKPHERDTPLVWQSLALFPFLNVQENVEFGLKMKGIKKKERELKAREWLKRLEINQFSNWDVNKLSGGQQQRVALARALITEPKILLLDEPLSALDAHLVVRMQQVLTKLQREIGITFIYVTHSQSEAFAMADRVVIMGNGEISQTGVPRDIYRAPANRFVAEFIGRNNILSGNISSIKNGIALVSTSAGKLKIKNHRGATVGQNVTFVISADLVKLCNQYNNNRNNIACRLISEEFIGSVVTLFLESKDGTEFKVQIQERELVDINFRGDNELIISWEIHNAHLLPELET